jgi:hypothetical protein
MRRNVEVNDVATLMRENEEDVENAEGDCRNSEEINRGKQLDSINSMFTAWIELLVWTDDGRKKPTANVGTFRASG